MVIPQPERILLREQIKKNSQYIKGIVLDVGAGGFKRYDDLLKFDRYLTLDINSKNKPDILASADNIPLENNSVNSVLCTQVLGDIFDFQKVADEFYRILKSGGTVLLTESLLAEKHDEPYDFWRFTDFSLKSIFEKSGFKIITSEQRGGYFSVMAQLKTRYIIDYFNLYSRWWAQFFNPFFKFYAYSAIFLDKIDRSKANQRHSLGWLVVAQK